MDGLIALSRARGTPSGKTRRCDDAACTEPAITWDASDCSEQKPSFVRVEIDGCLPRREVYRVGSEPLAAEGLYAKPSAGVCTPATTLGRTPYAATLMPPEEFVSAVLMVE